jgi:hypothetical protein
MAGLVSGDGCCSWVLGVCGWLVAFEIWGGGGWKFQRGMEMEGLSAFCWGCWVVVVVVGGCFLGIGDGNEIHVDGGAGYESSVLGIEELGG